jgi:ribonuclease P protein component
MARKRFGFGPAARLVRKGDFEAVFRARHVLRVFPLKLWARPRETGDGSRLGLAVSRKAGNAVRRNRLRRLVREAFRLHRQELDQDWDIVVSIAPGGEMADWPAVRNAFHSAIAKLNAEARP